MSPADRSESGDRVPDALGDRVPDALGDRVPDALGDWVPDALGDRAPDALGDWAPDALGDWAPDALGDWAPEVLGPPGEVRKVVTAPDAVLSRGGADVDPLADDVVRLAADLIATMRVSPGCVGLAGPQVGVGGRIFAVDVTGHPKTLTSHGTFVLCNARVIEASRWRPGREGCMSVPDLTGDIKRASRLVVEGVLPGTGRTVRVVTDGFEARALQHEIDHCAGLLFLDRVAGAHAVYQRKVYQ